jgi:hypothetical protein
MSGLPYHTTPYYGDFSVSSISASNGGEGVFVTYSTGLHMRNKKDFVTVVWKRKNPKCQPGEGLGIPRKGEREEISRVLYRATPTFHSIRGFHRWPLRQRREVLAEEAVYSPG